jgi:hypothetical protein
MIPAREVDLENAAFSKDPASWKPLLRIITDRFDIVHGYFSTGA